MYISSHYPDDTHPIVTVFGVVGGMAEVIKRAMFGDDRLIAVGSAGSRKVTHPL